MKSTKEQIEFVTATHQSGQRIDKLLSANYQEFSRSYVKKIILQGGLYVNNKNIKDPSIKVINNQKITLKIPSLSRSSIDPQNIPLDILYEDKYLIVLNKKAGMVVHPGSGNYKNTLVNALLYHCGENLSGIGGVQRPGIVHRLDKDTSGIMLVAKQNDAHRILSKNISLKKIKRVYRTFVWGVPVRHMGEINLNIARDNRDRIRMAVVKDRGRIAVTQYKVISNYKFASKLECNLLTGRTHQIRVHLSHSGFPIIGDTLYTKGRNLSKSMPYIINNFNRQALHSYSISFEHPIEKKTMEFNQGLPEDMKNLESELGKYNKNQK